MSCSLEPGSQRDVTYACKRRSAASIVARAPGAPALLVLAAYAFWIVLNLPSSQRGLAFADVGDVFRHKGSGSARIDTIPSSGKDVGYDGQFVYFIALDPIGARSYIDAPPYRYGRILLSVMAMAISLDQTAIIPYAIVLINWLAVGLGTWFVAIWLRRHNVSHWFALIYGLYPGLFVTVKFDVTEALAYCFVAAAMLTFDVGRCRYLPWTALLFACAMLSRETTVLFVLPVAVALFAGHLPSSRLIPAMRVGMIRTVSFLFIALAPYAAWKIAIRIWLGSFGFYSSLGPTLKPFGGLLAWYPWNGTQVNAVRCIVVPATLCLAAAVHYLIRRGFASLNVWLLIVNIVILVVCLNASSYDACPDVTRIATGVPLAALYALPEIDTVTLRNRVWLLGSAMLWLWLYTIWLTVPVGIYPP